MENSYQLSCSQYVSFSCVLTFSLSTNYFITSYITYYTHSSFIVRCRPYIFLLSDWWMMRQAGHLLKVKPTFLSSARLITNTCRWWLQRCVVMFSTQCYMHAWEILLVHIEWISSSYFHYIFKLSDCCYHYFNILNNFMYMEAGLCSKLTLNNSRDRRIDVWVAFCQTNSREI